MKQPIIKSTNVVKYQFERLTPVGISVKDSCSFLHGNADYMVCTNISDGGLVVFKKEDGRYHVFQKLFVRWSDMWAPCVVEQDGKLFVFCSDTGGLQPFWKTQRIRYFEYVPGRSPEGPEEVPFGVDRGRIDPEIFKIGDTYHLLSVVMDWTRTDENGREWWDIYCTTSKSLFGPYTEEKNLSGIMETGIEEAPHVIGSQLFWSAGDSDVDSHIRRGDIVQRDGKLNIVEDTDFRMGAVGSPVCTHPDSFYGKIRATLKAGDEFFIGELQSTEGIS